MTRGYVRQRVYAIQPIGSASRLAVRITLKAAVIGTVLLGVIIKYRKNGAVRVAKRRKSRAA